MRFVTIAGGKQGRPGALLRTGEILDLRAAAISDTIEAWLPNSVAEILCGGDAAIAVAQAMVRRTENGPESERARMRQSGTLLSPDTALLTPIPNPSLIVAAGLAYRSHLAEMSGTPTPPHPTGFMKSPTSLCGSGALVHLPSSASENLDYEGELAVVFGRDCHRVGVPEALEYVAGYMVGNDFSARDWVQAVWRAQAPWEARLTWEVNIMGKQFPGFTALGPALVTRDEIPDLPAVRLRTRINGAIVQDAPVSDLIFDVAQSIAHFSQWYSFRPGDILLTGTPAGVGVGRNPPLFLKVGDRVDVEIDMIGTLSNVIDRGR